MNQFPYYEDIYGTRNYDEDFDRHADECEDETDSDHDRRPPAHRDGSEAGFFKKYASEAKKPPKAKVHKRTGKSWTSLASSARIDL